MNVLYGVAHHLMVALINQDPKYTGDFHLRFGMIRVAGIPARFRLVCGSRISLPAQLPDCLCLVSSNHHIAPVGPSRLPTLATVQLLKSCF